MASDKKLFSKIVLIVFLAMVVVGFTVPLFQLGGNNDAAKVAEPRICQTDSDCYLLCNQQPVSILCKQNLCQLNSCTETSIYPFGAEVMTVSLVVLVEGQKTPLVNLTSPKDVFVTVGGDMVTVHTSGLTLKDILEKFRIQLDQQCLTVEGQQYCSKEGKQLKILVNGEDSFSGYVPVNGDKVEIRYSKLYS